MTGQVRDFYLWLRKEILLAADLKKSKVRTVMVSNRNLVSDLSGKYF